MELNLIATGIELLGASVAKLTVDNTIVDIENDAQRSFGMTINEPQFQNIEKTKEIFSQMTIDFDIIINHLIMIIVIYILPLPEHFFQKVKYQRKTSNS